MKQPSLLRLTFPRQIEEKYLWDRTDAFVPVLRFCVFLIVAIYFAYLGGDYWLFRRFDLPLIYGAVFGVAAPAALLGISVTYTRHRDRWVQMAIYLATVINGATLIVVCVLAPAHNAPLPYSCLIIFMFYGYFLLGISHRWATPLAAMTALAYLVGAWKQGVPAATLYDQGSMMSVSVVIGALGSRVMELSGRRDWLNDHRLRELAERDAVTGLLNQATFFQRADVALQSARVQDRVVCFMIVGLKHLPAYSHQFAHPDVDDCLRRIGNRLAGSLPLPEDLAGRLGGEQFMLMLHDCPDDKAAAFAQELSGAVSGLRVPHPGAPLGVASVFHGSVSGAATLFATARAAAYRADESLYRARSESRWHAHTAIAAA